MPTKIIIKDSEVIVQKSLLQTFLNIDPLTPLRS